MHFESLGLTVFATCEFSQNAPAELFQTNVLGRHVRQQLGLVVLEHVAHDRFDHGVWREGKIARFFQQAGQPLDAGGLGLADANELEFRIVGIQAQQE